MKGLIMLVVCGSLVAGGVAIAHAPDVVTPVVTVGPLEPPLLPPRIRIASERPDSVHVWYEIDGSERRRGLGMLRPGTTRTFQIPATVRAIRIVAEPIGTTVRLVTGAITIGLETDIALVLAAKLEESRVEVGAVHVVRTIAP